MSQYLQQCAQERTTWRLLKLFPQCFKGGPVDEWPLTHALWMQCHLLLDDGVEVCAQCQAIDRGVYCRQCGTARHATAPQGCPVCQTPGAGPYCAQCGTLLQHPVLEALDAGTYDWAAWEQSLTPFLGGATPREQALLADERFAFG